MRWIGPFPTSNVAGMELAMCLCLSVLAIAWAYGRIRTQKHNATVSKTKDILYKIVIGVACFSAITTAALLICTGSRAGTLSALTGITFLACVRSIPWKAMIAINILLILCTLFAPFQTRYTTMTSDSSVAIRFTLWSAALNVIEDHPMHGLGPEHAVNITNDWYMPAQEKEYRIGSVLNDPLTIATRNGLPTLALFLLVVGAAFSIGIQHAWHKNSIACIGISILIPHIISGQFQAHLLRDWWPIPTLWVTGIVLSLIGDPRKLNYKLISACCIALLLLCVSLPMLGSILGNSQWSTQKYGDLFIASPRHLQDEHDQQHTGLIVCIGHQDAPHAALVRWREARVADNYSIIMCETLPNAAWWQDLAQHPLAANTHIRILASAEHGTAVWNAWRQGNVDTSNLIICDPSAVPAAKNTHASSGSLKLIISSLGFTTNSAEVTEAAEKDQAQSIRRKRSFTAAWWAHPEMDLPTSIKTTENSRE